MIREKSKGKLCKNCKNLKAYYKPKNCFIINKKLYYKWEKKQIRSLFYIKSLIKRSQVVKRVKRKNLAVTF